MINIEKASYELINTLAQRKDVKKVSSDHGWEVNDLGEKVEAVNTKVTEPEWNVKHINADKLWKEGIKGKGWTVANADTGIHYEHEALIKQYRGSKKSGKVEHDYNWYDGVREMHFTRSNKCGYGIKAPCDVS